MHARLLDSGQQLCQILGVMLFTMMWPPYQQKCALCRERASAECAPHTVWEGPFGNEDVPVWALTQGNCVVLLSSLLRAKRREEAQRELLE